MSPLSTVISEVTIVYTSLQSVSKKVSHSKYLILLHNISLFFKLRLNYTIWQCIQTRLSCLEILIFLFLSTSIPKLLCIHLNQDAIVLALLKRISPVKSDFFLSNPIISCFDTTLFLSLDISMNISFIKENCSSNLHTKLDFSLLAN